MMIRHAILLLTLALLAGIARAECNEEASSAVLSVALPGHPFAVIPSTGRQAGCWLFVSLDNGNIAILRRDHGSVELRHTVKVKGHPLGMALTPDGKTLIVASGHSVLFLDVKRLKSGRGDDPTIASISDGDNPMSGYLNVTANGRFLFVSDEAAQTISVVDLEHNRKSIGTIPVGIGPIALTFSKDGRYLYTSSLRASADWNWPKVCKPEDQDPATAEVSKPEGAIIVVDVERAMTAPAHSVVSRVPAGCSPARIAIAPSGDRIYVTARGSNAVLAFDTGKLVSDPDRARLAMTNVGTAPVPIAVAAAGKLIIVGNSNRFDADQSKAQMLDVLSADPLEVVSHIQAGAFPREMKLSPDGNTLYITNSSSDSLEIVNLKRAIQSAGFRAAR
jgi:DNA-binding beta-propeller fold protein YncE